MAIAIVFWLICAIFSAILASHKNRSAVGWFFVGLLLGPFGLLVVLFPNLRNAPAPIPIQDDFEGKWATLTKYDEATRVAVKSLEAYGTQAIAELKNAYRAIGDPFQLPRIAAQIARETEESRDPEKLMAKFSITREGNQYVYRGYRYDKLEDAVNYARRQNARFADHAVFRC